MNSGIYALENQSDGKVYIGQSKNLEKRKCTHFWLLKSNRHFNIHLQRAWNRGDGFVFKILELCEPEELNEKEIAWIEKYNAMNEGYNFCEGGVSTCGYHFTEEQKQKISKANSGRKRSQEACDKARATLFARKANDKEFAERMKATQRRIALERGFGGHNRGSHHTEEEKRNLSEKLKGRHISEEHRQKLHDLYCGEKSLSAKLKESDVIDIRYRFLCGERQIDILKSYPLVTPQTIYDIVRFRRWRHIPNTIEELEERKWKQEA